MWPPLSLIKENWIEECMWIKDPKDKSKSVSLTLLVASFVGLLIASGLEIAGVVETTSGLSELFYSTVALYFGRRFKVNTREFESKESSNT